MPVLWSEGRLVLRTASASRASPRFFFLSYRFRERNRQEVPSGSSPSRPCASVDGWSKVLVLSEGYRTSVWTPLRPRKVSLKMPAVNWLFTRIYEAVQKD